MDTALELLAEGGIEAVTMQGVAAAADVAKGLGYSYFSNRDELLLSLLRREADRLYEQIQTRVSDQATFEDAIAAALDGWLDIIEERGNVIGMLLRARHLEPVVTAEVAKMNRTLEGFYAGLAEEHYGVPRRRGEIAAAVLLHGLDGLVERWTSCGDSREELHEVYVRMTRAVATELSVKR